MVLGQGRPGLAVWLAAKVAGRASGSPATDRLFFDLSKDFSVRPLFPLGLVLALAACSEPAPQRPLTLPAADGRAAEIVIGDGFRYVVNQQALAQSLDQVYLRVTRASAPELGYADGLTAKTVAEAYCAGFNRALDPVAYGKFSVPASWLFEGGCE